MSQSRTFVLVHGAWHGGWCWRRVADLLAADGHRVYTPTLTGLADRSHLIDARINLDTHIADVVGLITWERLDNIVLCGHSYAGFVISGVAEKAPSAIASIVFLDAHVPADGAAMVALTSQAIRDNIKTTLERGDAGIPPPKAAFFKVNEKDQPLVDSLCTPQPVNTFTQKLALTGARERIAKKTYVRARDYDNPTFQAAYTRLQTDAGWRVHLAPCGHDVMLDMPEWLAGILRAAM
jgi:pimeloyl-ACP methyl ester carboxylesterase